MKRLVIILFLCATGVMFAQPNTMSFSFTTPPGPLDTSTSAAVYDSTGAMVKVLWGLRIYPPGTYAGTWDGTVQSGAAASAGTYTIKVLEDQVQYAHDRLGSTEKLLGTNQRWASFSWQQGTQQLTFAPVTNKVWFASGYPEGAYTLGFFTDVNVPQTANLNYFQSNATQLQFQDIASDGNWVYLMNISLPSSGTNQGPSYTTAIDAASGLPEYFSSGTLMLPGAACSIPPTVACGVAGGFINTTISYIDYLAPGSSMGLLPTGIAVQRDPGNILAIAHGGQNVINLFNKKTGTSLGTITGITNPTWMAFSSEGLWVVSRPSTGYANTTNASSTVTLTSGSFSNAASVVVSGVYFGGNAATTVASGGGTNTLTLTGTASATVTGAAINVNAPGQLYLVTGVGGSNTVTQPFTSGTFSNVISVGTNGSNGNLFVLDGGTHQQMYEYAVNTHTLMRTYGDPGGYSNCDPTVSKTKLMLDKYYVDGTYSPYRSWARITDNDEVWLADTGNSYRILHISPSNSYMGRLQYQRPLYQVQISHNQPNRLFSTFFEYAVDYTKPVLPGDPDPALGGNGSWEFVKNWNACIYTTGGFQPTVNGIYNVEQLTSGATTGFYAWLRGPTSMYIGLLPSSGGPMAKKNYTINGVANAGSITTMMARDGHLKYLALQTGTSPNFTMNFFDAPLLGFAGDGSPQWGALTQSATVTTNASNSFLVPSGGGGGQVGGEPTSDGVYVVYAASWYNSSATTYQPHLGGVKSGFASYAWAALPEVCMLFPDYKGNFPCSPSYPTNPTGVNPPMVEGQNILIPLNGQGATWGNQFYHVWSDGLTVGQFGQKIIAPGTMSTGATPFANGTYGYNYGDSSTNAIRFVSVTVNGDVYFYHGGEGGYAPFHRWHISNLASIHEWGGSAALAPGSTVTLTQLF